MNIELVKILLVIPKKHISKVMVKVNELLVYSLFQFISSSNQLIVKEYLRNTSPTMSQQIHKLNPVNIWGNVYLIIRYTFLIQQCLCLFTVWTSRNSEYSNLSIHIETTFTTYNKYTNIKNQNYFQQQKMCDLLIHTNLILKLVMFYTITKIPVCSHLWL